MMSKEVAAVMDEFDKNHPSYRGYAELMDKHISRRDGAPCPSKPIAINTGIAMDKSTHNHKKYDDNFEGLSKKEMAELNKELKDPTKAVLYMMAPEMMLGDDPELDTHKDIIKRYMGKSGSDKVIKELFMPLLMKLHDDVGSKDTHVYHTLSPAMVKTTKHTPDDYHNMLVNTFLSQAMHSQKNKIWEKKLPKIFQKLMEKSNGKT